MTLVLRRKQDACYDRDLRALTDDWGVIRDFLLDFASPCPTPARAGTHPFYGVDSIRFTTHRLLLQTGARFYTSTLNGVEPALRKKNL